MTEFKRLSITEAHTLIKKQSVTLADIRDEMSFQQSRIDNAIHLDGNSLQSFIENADPEQPLIIYCYHGNSSLSAAQLLLEKGFDEVYSMDGGFEAWRQQLPTTG